MFKIKDEPDSPSKRGVFKLCDEPEVSGGGGGCAAPPPNPLSVF